MRPPVVAGTIVLAGALIVASFAGGRYAEQQAQKRSRIAADQSVGASSKTRPNRNLFDEADSNDHVLVANVASVSFGELWDVMRAGAPEKRVEWAHDLEQLPPGPRRNGAIKSFYKIWVELDPTAAAKGVEKIADKRVRSMAFAAAADAAADSALPEMADLEFRLGYRSRQFNASSIVGRWADADPEAVAHFLEAHPDNDPGQFFNVTYSWANIDPDRAAQWFANIKLPPLQNPKYPRQEDHRRLEAARGLLLAWLDKDSRGAAVYVAAHTDNPDINKALGEFGESLFIRSHDQATALIQSLPNEDAQHAALKEILGHIGTRAITLTEGGDDEEPPEPEINPNEIPAWLMTLPSDVKSKAIVEYCASASAEQGPNVFELITHVADANARRSALQRFVENLGDDPSEARDKIMALPITTQQKQTLLQMVKKDQ